jgi:catechol 2,3-dioxygenase-like lactoylglutathione lyase family enzyme
MSPQFVVSDLEMSIEFYTKKLGFVIDFLYEDFYAGISIDGFSIHLKSGEPLVEERKNKREKEGLDITFSVDGIEGLHNRFLNKTVEIIQPLREMPYGREFYLMDPDGYIIAFLEKAS